MNEIHTEDYILTISHTSTSVLSNLGSLVPSLQSPLSSFVRKNFFPLSEKNWGVETVNEATKAGLKLIKTISDSRN